MNPFGLFNLHFPDYSTIPERAAVEMPEGTLSQTASVPRACAFPHFPWLTTKRAILCARLRLTLRQTVLLNTP